MRKIKNGKLRIGLPKKGGHAVALMTVAGVLFFAGLQWMSHPADSLAVSWLSPKTVLEVPLPGTSAGNACNLSGALSNGAPSAGLAARSGDPVHKIENVSATACLDADFGAAAAYGRVRVDYSMPDSQCGDTCTGELCGTNPGAVVFTSANRTSWKYMGSLPHSVPQASSYLAADGNFRYVRVCRGGGGHGRSNLAVDYIAAEALSAPAPAPASAPGPAAGLACTLSVVPATIEKGQDVSIRWTSSGAQSGSINYGIGSIGTLSSGSVTRAPVQSTNYLATFVAADGTKKICEARVAVALSEWERLFRAFDAEKGDKYLRSTDSGYLAWGNSYVIDGYLALYEATGDKEYMDKAMVAIDEELSAARADTARDYYGWQSDQTSADGKEYPYLVHDGMILAPIAKFARMVKERPELAEFKLAADRYIKTIESKFIRNWDQDWVEVGSRGYYTVRSGLINSQNRTNYPAGSSLPHNQNAAYGRFLLELNKATNNAEYRQKALKIANGIKSALRLEGSRWEWNYSDKVLPADPSGRLIVPEDASHANLVVGFAVDLNRAGVVFSRTEIQYFTNTLNYMYHDTSHRLTERVDGSGGLSDEYSTNLSRWSELASLDSRAQQPISNLLKNSGLGAKNSFTYAFAVANMARAYIESL